MISTRNGHLIIGKFGVPVREITERIIERQELENITKKYPIDEQEVFECLDAVADLDTFSSRDRLKLKNVGTEEDIQVQTVAITDNLFLKIIQYGRIFSQTEKDFNKLFDIGFLNLSFECYEDLKNGHREFENSELHSIVFEAFENMINGQISIEKIYNLLKLELDEIKI